jgi:hypothetical protein
VKWAELEPSSRARDRPRWSSSDNIFSYASRSCTGFFSLCRVQAQALLLLKWADPGQAIPAQDRLIYTPIPGGVFEGVEKSLSIRQCNWWLPTKWRYVLILYYGTLKRCLPKNKVHYIKFVQKTKKKSERPHVGCF